MTGFFDIWFSFVGGLATAVLGIAGYFVWRIMRSRRNDQSYLERQRQRRLFWGYE